jgi:hypothetical protein
MWKIIPEFREFHALLKAKDPGFGDLVRVMNKRDETPPYPIKITHPDKQ